MRLMALWALILLIGLVSSIGRRERCREKQSSSCSGRSCDSDNYWYDSNNTCHHCPRGSANCQNCPFSFDPYSHTCSNFFSCSTLSNSTTCTQCLGYFYDITCQHCFNATT